MTSKNGYASTIETATRHVLSNGMIALIQRNPNTPTVTVRGEVRIGAVHEPAAKSGLAVFTGAALIRGTAERTYQQIVAETEALGASVNAGGGLHGSGFQLGCSRVLQSEVEGVIFLETDGTDR